MRIRPNLLQTVQPIELVFLFSGVPAPPHEKDDTQDEGEGRYAGADAQSNLGRCCEAAASALGFFLLGVGVGIVGVGIR